jgi:antitoxin component of MazEF toxin-antitoxin module
MSERTHQVIGKEGLQIPLAVMQQYGWDSGTAVTLELESDGIRIVMERAERHTIEKQALRYVLRQVGDAATIQVHSLVDGWRVEVYGAGMTDPAGILRYSLTGELLPEHSTSPTQMRQVLRA